MKRSMLFAVMLVVIAVVSIVSAQAGDKGGEKTIVGYISDSMCGLNHAGMNMGNDKECSIKCVDGGAKFVLADSAHKVVYHSGRRGSGEGPRICRAEGAGGRSGGCQSQDDPCDKDRSGEINHLAFAKYKFTRSWSPADDVVA